MSQENVELVKSLQPTDVDLVEVFASDEVATQAMVDAFAGVFGEDFAAQFISSEMELPEYRGVGGFIAAWGDWLAPWASYRIEAERFIDAGHDVVVLARIRGRTARDGVTVEHTPAAIWSLREGKVVALRFYLDREEALKAAGR